MRILLECIYIFFRESANLLQQESGILLHSPIVNQFRDFILQGKWEAVSSLLLEQLGVTNVDKQHVSSIE